MELIEKNNDKMVWKANLDISLANALRRSVMDIPVLAIAECDVYKNDSVLYDEIIAHRLGLLPLKNQKLKKGEVLELKLKKKAGKEESIIVESGELGDSVIYPDMPIVLLENGQTLEVVARAGVGTGREHSKFTPGLMFYRQYPTIKIGKEGEALLELAENYPEVFEFKDKLKVKDAWKCVLDNEDVEKYPGIEISFGNDLVFVIESWGQMKVGEIFTSAAETLKGELDAVLKALK
ncbi:DNA-directed RNA polymerase subunit D [Candidatus Pacearchaeota archaeon]|nr:DNA-directed RNA polymerase subunit D [Candidatus Pacearchaeota archaeon]|tara:strand:- start:13176 stop:13883 length:708 start_codon:yes stop_codon:yes gene_type:complete